MKDRRRATGITGWGGKWMGARAIEEWQWAGLKGEPGRSHLQYSPPDPPRMHGQVAYVEGGGGE